MYHLESTSLRISSAYIVQITILLVFYFVGLRLFPNILNFLRQFKKKNKKLRMCHSGKQIFPTRRMTSQRNKIVQVLKDFVEKGCS